ncbi:MAG: hypothetical protein V2A79_09530 [Planctomycetota bacterium]
MFFEKTGPVWETLRDLEHQLQEADIGYVIISGLRAFVEGRQHDAMVNKVETRRE